MTLQAQPHAVAAKRLYRLWGAKAKLELLEKTFFSIGAPVGTADSNAAATAGADIGAHHLDLQTIMRASQTLSSLLALDDVQRSLLQLATQDAGAERGVLITVEGDAAFYTRSAVYNPTIRRLIQLLCGDPSTQKTAMRPPARFQILTRLRARYNIPI